MIEAIKDGKVEYWVAGMPPDRAVDAVLVVLGSEWRLSVTDRMLSPDRVAALKLSEGEALRVENDS